jgi:hypothetical protein
VKFAVGYQLAEEGEEPFAEVVRDYQEHIAEVYFAWLGMASGRSPLAVRRGYVDWAAQQRLERDLGVFREMGVRLDLLLNANCYGGRAISQHLQNEVASVLEHLGEVCGGVEAITTTSLLVARTVKTYFPEVEVRASVNVRIGTVKGMSYVAALFDGYYVQREYNRDLGRVRELKRWVEDNGKGLYMLANSGCLNYCSGQTFHDNMVAHEVEIAEMQNVEGWMPHVCWNLFRDRANWPLVLQNSWIRPEDMHQYDDLFPVVKLATRMHQRPRLVLEAYTGRRYRGNLLDLFEPGYAPAFAPHIIDNERFPADWFERTAHCDNRCEQCDYCASVLDQVLVRVDV